MNTEFTSFFAAVMLALGTVAAQPDVSAYGLITDVPEDPLADLDGHELFLAHFNPLTGECTKISEDPIGDIFALNGLAYIDPTEMVFWFAGNQALYGADTETGALIETAPINAPEPGSLNGLHYNMADSTTYGYYHAAETGDNYIVRIEFTSTGADVVYVSQEPLPDLYSMFGLTAIDPFLGHLYMYKNQGVAVIDLAEGNEIYTLDTAPDESVMFLRFNPADSTVYGLLSEASQSPFGPNGLTLCKVTAQGIETVGSQLDMNQVAEPVGEGLAMIDPDESVYYYEGIYSPGRAPGLRSEPHRREYGEQ